jgi:hypothetical protein
MRYCKLLGLSLSFCVRDILEGKVSIDDVECIISCTRFENASQAFDFYINDYWSKYPKETVNAVLMEVWPLVFQPRFNNERGHTIANGYWFNHETGVLEYIHA